MCHFGAVYYCNFQGRRSFQGNSVFIRHKKMLYLPTHLIKLALGKVEAWLQALLILNLCGVEWSPLRSDHFINAEDSRYPFVVNGCFPFADWRRRSRESNSLARPVASY